MIPDVKEKFDITETLHFVETHFDNHMRHIDRILTQTNP